jgi:hypothetical protein
VSDGSPVVGVDWVVQSVLAGVALPVSQFAADDAGGGGAATAAALPKPMTTCRVGKRIFDVGETVYVARNRDVGVALILSVTQAKDGQFSFRGRKLRHVSTAVSESDEGGADHDGGDDGAAAAGVGGAGPERDATCTCKGLLVASRGKEFDACSSVIVEKCIVLDSATWATSLFGCSRDVWMGSLEY